MKLLNIPTYLTTATTYKSNSSYKTTISDFLTTSSFYTSNIPSSMPMKKIMFFFRQTVLISLVVIVFLCAIQIDLIRGAFEDANNNNVKITEQSLELTQTINLQRQEYLQKQCYNLGYSMLDMNDLTKLQMEHMLVDRTHKLLYCYVPKVACTNWKRILMILTGKWQNGTDPLEISGAYVHTMGLFETFYSLNESEKEMVFSDYTKFLVVRHPFERLLSAYRNKFVGDKPSAQYFQDRIGRLIVKYIRANPSNHSLEYGNDVTFQEFVQYLLATNVSLDSLSSYNEHWEPIVKLCNPCVMKYNVIGKYETILDDSTLALYLTGAENISFPSGLKPLNTRPVVQQYYEDLPIKDIRRLYDIYADDFKLFDYSVEDVLGFEFG